MTNEGSHEVGGLERHEVALLAHEVRGALTVIVGMSELLHRDLEPDERQRALDGIARAVDRIDRLVDDALGGGLEAAVRPAQQVDLAELAEHVAAEQSAVTGRRVTVVADARPVIAGCRESLERAVANLIENGLKYSLASSAVEVRVRTQGNTAVVEVADRGPGVDPGDRNRIFEPFERAGDDGVDGTGLGLTVVRSVVEAHGGSVSVAERPGGGSVFHLELPVVPR